MSPGPAVEVDGLWEAYRPRGRFGWRRGEPTWALRDVHLAVDPGRCTGVVGGNGSGKTTLLQVIAGVLRPTRGRVSVRGRVASLVDLSAGFHRDLTGHENLLVGGVLLGLTRREVRERYHDIVAFSGLSEEALGWPLAAYSAGMGLRLGFSLVVHTAPDVLLVDEVLAVGDATFQAQCLSRVEELRRAGCAVVIVSHDLELVSEHCQEVAVLASGELVTVGPAAEALDVYRNRAPAAPADERLYAARGKTFAARRKRGAVTGRR
jgi:ABC-type polysaccharide/polyol phosphate transport system ATPase subunit